MLRLFQIRNEIVGFQASAVLRNQNLEPKNKIVFRTIHKITIRIDIPQSDLFGQKNPS